MSVAARTGHPPTAAGTAPRRTTRHRPGTAVLPKGRERREAILDAATAVLVHEGYARLSTRKIAARAGIQPGNLQYYYRSKQDVVRAVLERYLERAIASVEARIAAADDGTPADRLQSAVDGILADQQSPDGCRFFFELWALAAHDATVAEMMHDFYTRWWRRSVALLLEINPQLGRPRAERRTALLIAMFEGLTLFRSRRPPYALPLPALEKELRALALHLALEDC
jgi:AcrR family transcriptional regulator